VIRVVCVGLVAAAISTAVGCRSNGAVPQPAEQADRAASPTLLQVSMPVLTGADKDAERQLRDAHAALTATTARAGATPDVLSEAYGQLGALLMAAELYDSAEPCLRNAHTLAVSNPRWTYYLAQLYRLKGDLATSAAFFERTLVVQPNNVAALWWLGTVRVDGGRLGDAEAAFSRALALQPGALSAVYGLGRSALARGEHARAVEYFERVLAMNPRALAAHYPLGLAYRGLGRIEQADLHLRQRSHMEILPVDPLMNELGALLRSATAFQDRGMRASLSGNWAEAVAQFRQAVALAPDDATARLSLSTSLLQAGDAAGALVEAREALRRAPADARARRLVASLSGAGRPQ
jgi:tetratricopeptide (TPR) repeat protein